MASRQSRRWWSVAIASLLSLMVHASGTRYLRTRQTLLSYEERDRNFFLRGKGINENTPFTEHDYSTQGDTPGQHLPSRGALLHSIREREVNDEDCDAIRRGSIPDGVITPAVPYVFEMNLTIAREAIPFHAGVQLQMALQRYAAPVLAGCEDVAPSDTLVAKFNTPLQKDPTTDICSLDETSIEVGEVACIVTETEVDIYSTGPNTLNVEKALIRAIKRVWSQVLAEVHSLESAVIGPAYLAENDPKDEEPGTYEPSAVGIEETQPRNSTSDSSSDGGDDGGGIGTVLIVAISASAVALLLIGVIWRRRKKGKSKDKNTGNEQITMPDDLEVRTWYTLREKFSSRNQEDLFYRPLSEMLREHPSEVQSWLQQVQLAWIEVSSDNDDPDEESTSEEVKGKVKSVEDYDVKDDVQEEEEVKSYDSLVMEIEVLTWFSLKDQFPSKDAELFELSSAEILLQKSDEIKGWLKLVKQTWDDNHNVQTEFRSDAGSSTTSQEVVVVGDHRDDGSNSSETEADDDSSMVREIEVRTWFSLQEEYQPLDDSLFQVSANEVLLQRSDEIEDWLAQVQAAWDKLQGDETEVPMETEQDAGESPASDDYLAVKEIEIRTWFSLQKEFKVLDESLFEMSAAERLEQDPSQINSWLAQVEAAWDECEKETNQKEGKVDSLDVSAVNNKAINLSESMDTGEQYDPAAKEIEIREWFALQAEFHAFDESLFEMPIEERMQQHPKEVRAWLCTVETDWKARQENKSAAGEFVEDAAKNDDSDSSSSGTSDEEFDPMIKEIEVRTWFSLQEEFGAFDEDLFRMSADDRLKQKPRKVNAWLRKVQTAWDLYQRRQSEPQESDKDVGNADNDDDDTTQYSQYSEYSVVDDIEVRTWFSLQEEFKALDESLFVMPVEERLRQNPANVKAWLERVQVGWNEYEKRQGQAQTSPPANTAAAATITVTTAAAATATAEIAASNGDTKSHSLSSSEPTRRMSKSLSQPKLEASSKAAPKASSRSTAKASSSAASLKASSKQESRASSKATSSGPSKRLSSASSKSQSRSSGSKLSSEPAPKPSARIRSRSKSRRSTRALSTEPARTRSKSLVSSLTPSMRASKSPSRERSKSLGRLRSKSPSGERSKSFRRRWSKSPGRRWSKSPGRQASKSRARRSTKASSETVAAAAAAARAASAFVSDASVSSEDSMVKEIEVRTWFSMQDEFQAFDKALFEMPPEKRLQQHPHEVEAWLKKVQTSWNKYQKTSAKILRDESDEDEDSGSCSTGSRSAAAIGAAAVAAVGTASRNLAKRPSKSVASKTSAQAGLRKPQEISSTSSLGSQQSGHSASRKPKGLSSTSSQGSQGSGISARKSRKAPPKSKSKSSTSSSSSALGSTSRRGSRSPSKTRKPGQKTSPTGAITKASKLAAEATSESDDDSSRDSMVKEIEVRTWYSLQEEFGAFDKALFDIPPDERLRQDREKVKSWLRKVRDAWARYQKSQKELKDSDDDDEAEDESDYEEEENDTFEEDPYKDMVNDIEVRTWFSLQKEFKALAAHLFEMPADERLQQHPREIRAWLVEVQTAWSMYEKNQGETRTETTATTSTTTSTTLSSMSGSSMVQSNPAKSNLNLPN